ncbi:helix-turn-helix domain-containing protein [Actinokineospora fastidiosa]|uniref:AraC family transcriptional regulator n=1 Tax=Actinokineospora fastidiosa TaxID=1816 RepID=A0A918LHI5_9PSEU|nr:helix-turn-helix domain-containing protein [Actinokineospora fastidiosa]GGS48557.1 AraC family transcriptional regulator [Actinokineospora fastidiosa]
MTYRELRVDVPGVACLWSVDVDGPGGRVVPDGCTDLMWHAAADRLFVAGPDTTAHTTTLPPGRLVGVRYLPGAAGFGVPADALRDGRPDLADVWTRQAAEALTERLRGATAEEAQRILLLAAPAAPDPLAARVRLLAETGRVRDIADAVGYGERQLRRRCLAAFGYGPKTLHRVLRFQRALRLARAGLRFTDVAARAGYADQAHLARDVRDLAQAPLTALVHAPTES